MLVLFLHLCVSKGSKQQQWRGDVRGWWVLQSLGRDVVGLCPSCSHMHFVHGAILYRVGHGGEVAFADLFFLPASAVRFEQ